MKSITRLSPPAFAGILCAVCVYAIGGGLLEVLVSPVVEACPSDNKEKAMSMLHSFYCWGHVGVVALSTVFFGLFGKKLFALLALGGDIGCSGGRHLWDWSQAT